MRADREEPKTLRIAFGRLDLYHKLICARLFFFDSLLSPARVRRCRRTSLIPSPLCAAASESPSPCAQLAAQFS